MNFLLTDHITDFLAQCRQRGHSQNTLAAYRNALEKFDVFAKVEGVTQAEEISRTLLRRYAVHLSETLSPGGAHARLRPLKTFFNWLEADEVLEKSPMRRVALPKLPVKILPAVGPREIQALLTMAKRTRHPLRDKAIIGVLYDTGLRVSELCGLKMDDLQPGGRLEVRQAKGSRSRIVPISRTGVKFLIRYTKEERPKSTLPYIFLSEPESPMNRDSVKQLLERLCQAAAIGRFGAHTFRRGFAVNYLRNSGDVFSLQRILGHSSLEMTNRYAALHTNDLKEVHRRASPLSNVEGRSQ